MTPTKEIIEKFSELGPELFLGWLIDHKQRLSNWDNNITKYTKVEYENVSRRADQVVVRSNEDYYKWRKKEEQLEFQIKALKEVLEGYNEFEANLIGSNEAWPPNRGNPVFTDKLWGEFMDLQAIRNAVLKEKKSITIEYKK